MPSSTSTINTEGGNDFIGSGKLDGNGVPADFFSDVNVRKAFAYCFDWDTYIRDVEQGEGTQATDVMLHGEIGDDPNGAHYSYDPAKCADAFKASTWKSADGKSLWDTGFRLTIGYNTGNTARQTVAQIFQTDSPGQPEVRRSKPGPGMVELPDRPTRPKRCRSSSLAGVEDIPDPHNWVFTYSLGAFGGKQGMPQVAQGSDLTAGCPGRCGNRPGETRGDLQAVQSAVLR